MNKITIPTLLLGIAIGALGLFVVQLLSESADEAQIGSNDSKPACSSDTNVNRESDSVIHLPDDSNDACRPSAGCNSSEEPSSLVDEKVELLDTDSLGKESDLGDETKSPFIEDVKNALDGFSKAELKEIEELVEELIAIEPELPQIEFVVDLSGTVVDAQGDPVPNAKVHLDAVERRIGSAPPRFRNKLYMYSLAIKADELGVWRTVVKEIVGETSGLEIGVIATAPEYANSKIAVVRPKNNENRTGIELVMRGHGSLSGRVLDQNGVGVSGITVEIDKVGGRAARQFSFLGPEHSTVTDSSGRYEFMKLIEGMYDFSLSEKGIRVRSAPGQVTIRTGEECTQGTDCIVTKVHVLRFRPTSEGESITGFFSICFLDSQGNVISTISDYLLFRAKIVVLNEPPVGTVKIALSLSGYRDKEVNCTIGENESVDLGEIKLEELEDAD